MGMTKQALIDILMYLFAFVLCYEGMRARSQVSAFPQTASSWRPFRATM